MSERVIGQTASNGFQVGVRRTFVLPVQEAWALIASPEGMEIWLGGIDQELDLHPGSKYRTDEGITGEVRVVNELVNLRMTWKKEAWSHPSILQIRTISKGENTTISFHQEKLPGMEAREEMKHRWEDVLVRLGAVIHGR
ncbi:SRPBCC domain-containing protein [Paenibacillus sp. J22TS3]|uniref:SRPBCC family protein n=1 Tax=Paenibacillus sp. J22TS3 TaxID=2807192 RepID=UPI001B1ED6CC|nr:SRPBCC domain-containing protein [Paenibacillus sp. J22TS3]GIP24676.1 hypothetical protein J22TS3_49510 [Paenibacillus sp. J22TS3]